MVLPIFLRALNKTTYIQIHTTSYLKQWLKWSGARDNGTYGICDQQRPKEQLPACRHEANWPDNEGNQTSISTRWFFFFFFLGGGGGGVCGGGRVYGPFKNISLISSQSLIKSELKPEFIKSERKPENPGKMCRFTSSCTQAKSHPGLCSPFIHYVVSIDSVSGQQKPWSDCAYTEDRFSHRVAHTMC